MDFLEESSSDIILRTSYPEPTEFPAHRCILSIASGFWHDMFSLPQSSTEANTPRPIIDLSESTQTVERLLRLIYPVLDPPIDSLDAIVPVLEAAVKYDIPLVIEKMRKLLVTPAQVESAPLRVFAIAERFGLEEEAKIASRHTLSVNLLDSPLSEDLKHVTAYSYHQLLVLHRERAQAAQLLLDRHVPGGDHCEKCGHEKRWWVDYKKRAKEELAVRPTGNVVFEIKWTSKSVAACVGCAGNILRAMPWLDMMKQKVDMLRSTI
ncbi:hypothetical protein PUNSTDRAFT_118293 [Punctularia strigosozonata HHB-11173 SS5]|uniref:uncharacterized protein n=1 Tax=Punctularia strigosozonata (strain HHB-11173) TaxID=741275 RepID=UPI0004417AD3|nr:uncharacterized protein PUNSTDRAFT_118293 [Punctularia strigosozonata HHB-11173 SS5]EIN12471.1 hypothetical protein PUNSTDRAFT_118293 [Punctularia strigosozonata HHB-11173 SS5]